MIFLIIFKAVRREVFSNKQKSNYFVATKVFFRRGLQNRAKDARDFQKRSRLRFPAARALRYASHPTYLVANAFALRVFSASYTFSFRKKEGKKERK